MHKRIHCSFDLAWVLQILALALCFLLSAMDASAGNARARRAALRVASQLVQTRSADAIDLPAIALAAVPTGNAKQRRAAKRLSLVSTPAHSAAVIAEALSKGDGKGNGIASGTDKGKGKQDDTGKDAGKVTDKQDGVCLGLSVDGRPVGKGKGKGKQRPPPLLGQALWRAGVEEVKYPRGSHWCELVEGPIPQSDAPKEPERKIKRRRRCR
jgi:hypothetical protein